MSMSKHKLLPVQNLNSDAELSKGQKAFNKSLQQIEKLRRQLAAWDKAIPAYQEKYARELVPLFETMTELQIGLLNCGRKP